MFPSRQGAAEFSVPLSRIHFQIALLVAVVLTGCGEPMTSVTGTVTIDGKPLAVGKAERGTVVFHPSGGGALATGLIAGDGGYRVTTGGNTPLATGEYLVAVRVLEVIPRTESAEATGRPLTPAIYADPSTSGIKFLVKPGNNVCDIALRSDAGPVMPPENSEGDETSEGSDANGAAEDDAEETAADTAPVTAGQPAK